MPNYTLNMPQANQTVANSRQPIVDNFTNLNTTIGTDHIEPIYNAVPANRGKHNKVSLPQQGADPASTATESIFYTKQNPTAPNVAAPYFRAGLGGSDRVYNVPVSISAPFVAIVGFATIYDFVGKAPMAGTVMAYLLNFALHVRTVFSPFIWDGVNLWLPGIPPADVAGVGQLASSPGTLSRLTTNNGNLGGTRLQVLSTSGGACNAIITGVLT